MILLVQAGFSPVNIKLLAAFHLNRILVLNLPTILGQNQQWLCIISHIYAQVVFYLLIDYKLEFPEKLVFPSQAPVFLASHFLHLFQYTTKIPLQNVAKMRHHEFGSLAVNYEDILKTFPMPPHL